MNRNQWFGVLTLLGGLFWVTKAVSILMSGYQPPQLFEFGQALLGFGILSLYASLSNPVRSAKIGAWLAGLGIVSHLAATGYEQIPGAVLSGADDFVFPYSLFVLLASIGAFIGLLLVSLPTRKDETLPRPWRTVPLYIVLSFIPFAFTGALHTEIPIVLIGFGWTLFGYAVLKISGE